MDEKVKIEEWIFQFPGRIELKRLVPFELKFKEFQFVGVLYRNGKRRIFSIDDLDLEQRKCQLVLLHQFQEEALTIDRETFLKTTVYVIETLREDGKLIFPKIV